MNKDANNYWLRYLETNRSTTSSPVKIDVILKKRMQTFMTIKFHGMQHDET